MRTPASAVALGIVTLAAMAIQDAWPQASSQTHQTVRHTRVQEEDPVAEDLARAEEAIEKNNYSAALPVLQKIVGQSEASQPGSGPGASNYQAWFDLGFVYNALGQGDASIAAYRQSVGAKADVFESNLNLGLMLAKAGQADAAKFLRAATRLTPTANVDEGHARAWLSLAEVVKEQDPQEAIAAYQQAARLEPRDAEPHLAAGILLEKEGKFADAEQEYKQALALDPSSSEALAGLANLYMRGQRFSDAEDVLRKFVALHPQDAAAHLQLGRVLTAAGHPEEAADELQAVLKLEPNNTDARRELVDLYVDAKKYDLAEAQYRTLIGPAPKDAELVDRLGQTLLKEKKYPEAQQVLLVAVKLKPDLGGAYGDLAVAANENKDYALAIQAVDARAKFLPEIPMTYFLRATAYDHLLDTKRAAENYRQFLAVAGGRYPDQEWQARHRLIALAPKK
jgi:tetratricopeptide (TPR) repeat protein